MSFSSPSSDGFDDSFNDDSFASAERDSDLEFVSVGASGVWGDSAITAGLYDTPTNDRFDAASAASQAQKQVNLNDILSLNPAALSAVSGVTGSAQGKQQRAYLGTQRKGLWETGMHNVGTVYLGGIALGGTVGFFRGLITAPRKNPRILLNAVLNSSSKAGSAVGNTLGTLALLFTASEWVLEQTSFDTVPDMFGLKRDELYTTAAAGAMTGAIYRLPALTARKDVTGLAIMLVAAGLGAAAAAGSSAALTSSVANSFLGHK